MTQATTAFKMPYLEKPTDTYMTFSKKHAGSEQKRTKQVHFRLGRNDDVQTQSLVILGYN